MFSRPAAHAAYTPSNTRLTPCRTNGSDHTRLTTPQHTRLTPAAHAAHTQTHTRLTPRRARGSHPASHGSHPATRAAHNPQHTRNTRLAPATHTARTLPNTRLAPHHTRGSHPAHAACTPPQTRDSHARLHAVALAHAANYSTA